MDDEEQVIDGSESQTLDGGEANSYAESGGDTFVDSPGGQESLAASGGDAGEHGGVQPGASGAEPAPQHDPHVLGAAYALGVQNPEQYPPEQVAAFVRSEYQRAMQERQFARQVQGDWAQFEQWRRERAAGQGSQQGSAAAAPAEPKPEPFDVRKALEAALSVPQPPAYARELIEKGHVIQSPTGDWVAAPGSQHLVPAERLAEINKFASAAAQNDSSRIDTLQKAIDEIVQSKLGAFQKSQALERTIQSAAQQDQRLLQNRITGEAYLGTLYRLKDSGLDEGVRLGLARQAAHAAIVPALLHRLQSAAVPQQAAATQAPVQQAARPAAQPHSPDFLAVASHSANQAERSGGGKSRARSARSIEELSDMTFGEAERALRTAG